ncbi:MAG: hypothetical protein ACUVSF_11600 [Anaerolineae bacterium]
MASRLVSVSVAMGVGLLVLASYFIVDVHLDDAANRLIYIASIVAAFTLFLGLANLVRFHLDRIRTRRSERPYSFILLVALAATMTLGFIGGGPNSWWMQHLFDNVLFPLQAALYSLLAFFIVTATYRAFRIRNIESALFVIFAIVVLLGQTPAGALVWEELPAIKDWIFDVPVLAGTRGILLGVALGTLATGIRVLLGVDRPYVDETGRDKYVHLS